VFWTALPDQVFVLVVVAELPFLRGMLVQILGVE
jgi:hypothetical protein